ncbi:nucleotide-binding universal stress UspA family protein [Rhodovulum imhoffii]|uniref:Nucleotide-binding universal stress UspA family protein n=1 Tax=Rhodovulum imhoffii TaxID=365340 RepID=A0A2T5BPQ5_9RHOB|nr:universal stress protein [Rhodovulum imhoffii]MBK5933600.1 universal stress protein [Rhodovulum imhoffii]PTN01039.1 nucleotide-binding universal stress UspA family protein [Rhodovulum imhoffii]
MSQTFVVGYDGSDAARRAVQFALDRARDQNGRLVVAHVLEWSPYSFLTPTELEERHKRRREELQRAEKALLKPLLDSLKDAGVPVETALKYGNISDTLCDIAGEAGGTQIFIGRNGHSTMGSRIFGSVAGRLAQTASVPVTIVP